MRLYNGCPDSQLKALWDEEDRLMRAVRRKNPEAHCTRHWPPDEGYQVHVWGRLLAPMMPTKIEALQEALK